MLRRALPRLLLMAALLFAAQSALEHPFKHYAQGLAHSEQCDTCLAHAAFGAAAPSHAPIIVPLAPYGFAASARPAFFVAAFTPPFRSQAPPALL